LFGWKGRNREKNNNNFLSLVGRKRGEKERKSEWISHKKHPTKLERKWRRKKK